LDVSEYWKKRGIGYYDELKEPTKYEQARLKIQEVRVINLLNSHKFNSILEVGCGFGRYTKILYSLLKPQNYVAIDISKKQIENAKKYVGEKKIEFHCSKIQNFSTDQKFDLVFASEILMHIDFQDIKQVIQKLVSLSKNKIISIDWYDKNRIGEESGGYCFIHDYQTIFKNYKVKSIKIHPIPISLQLNVINVYAKLRGRHGFDRQAIIEVSV